MRIRVAGLVELDGGYALMHRMNVKEEVGTTKPFGNYFVFPGGGLEDDDKTYEDGVIREVLEEFGIVVKPRELIASRKIGDDFEEYLYICDYISGKLGTGTGPEFSGDPKYIDRGEYIPTIVSKEEFKKLRVLPEEFKEKIIVEFNL